MNFYHLFPIGKKNDRNGTSLVLFEEPSYPLGIKEAITLTQTVTDNFAINFSNGTQTNAALSEASKLGLAGEESNGAITETGVGSFAITFYAVSSTDNVGNATTPSSANGAPNNANAIITTDIPNGNLTNPVYLTSTFNISVFYGSTRQLKVWFNCNNLKGNDTVTLSYNVGAGDVPFYTQTSLNGAGNYLVNPLVVDVSALTFAQLQVITCKANYFSQTVNKPSSQIRLDAWGFFFS